MKIKLSKIKYDYDTPDEKDVVKTLPKTMTIVVNDDEYELAKAEPDDVSEYLSDIITEKTDFCVSSFEYKELTK